MGVFHNNRVHAALLWTLLRRQIAPRLRTWAERVSSRPWVQLLLFAPALLLIFGVLLFPTDIYQAWHAKKYGVSVQSWWSWLSDWTTADLESAAGIEGVR